MTIMAPQTSSPLGVDDNIGARIMGIGGDNSGDRTRSCFSHASRFFQLVTIEPLAFLVLMALYIEFPSIQDLIFTKICLQVISNHPNLTTLRPAQLPLTNLSSLMDIQSTTTKPPLSYNSLTDDRISFIADISFSNNDTANKTSPPRMHLLPMGRIQNHTMPHEDLINTVTTIHDDQYICDRVNNITVPSSIRDMIENDNYVFWLEYQIVICFLCALTSPYWGGMSDKIGRLVPLNVPIVMAIISNSLSLVFGLLISLKSHNLFKVQWLYIGALLTGISGGQAVIMMICFSFISDNTSCENRTKRVVVLESTIYVAHSVGYYISKLIMSIGLNHDSLKKPWLNRHIVAFSLCIIFNLIAFLYAISRLRHRKFHKFTNNFEREQQEVFSNSDIVSKNLPRGNLGRSRDLSSETNIINCQADRSLRELTSSTPDDLDGPIARADKSWTNLSSAFLTFKYYKQTFETLTKQRESRFIILLLLLCSFISAMSLVSLMSLLFLYLRNVPFNWSTSHYSEWNSIASLTRGLALVGLTLTKLFKVWNLSDPLVAAIGFLSKGAGLLMISLAQSSSLIDWSLGAFVLSEYSLPPIRSLLSKLVIKEEVGKVYSCLSAIQNICILAGNVLFYLTHTPESLQGYLRLSFLIVACFQFLALVIMLFIYIRLRHRVLIS